LRKKIAMNQKSKPAAVESRRARRLFGSVFLIVADVSAQKHQIGSNTFGGGLHSRQKVSGHLVSLFVGNVLDEVGLLAQACEPGAQFPEGGFKVRFGP
jgi:hypothetical protein